MLTYGAEAWALTTNHTIIERVHLFAIKRFLNVSARTPGVLVYGETGRYPLFIQTYTKCIKYWLKITRMQKDRIPAKTYKMLYNLHLNNKNNWVFSVCYTLYRYGYGYVWKNQGAYDIPRFLSEFKQRLIDCYLQDWNDALVTKDRFLFYSTFKESHSLSPYLSATKNAFFRKSLTRLRLGVSALNPHRLRYSKSELNHDCPFCRDTYESELHFVLVCPKYKALRELYIPAKFYAHPNAFKLVLLLSNTRYTTPLSMYLTKAFELRSRTD